MARIRTARKLYGVAACGRLRSDIFVLGRWTAEQKRPTVCNYWLCGEHRMARHPLHLWKYLLLLQVRVINTYNNNINNNDDHNNDHNNYISWICSLRSNGRRKSSFFSSKRELYQSSFDLPKHRRIRLFLQKPGRMGCLSRHNPPSKRMARI